MDKNNLFYASNFTSREKGFDSYSKNSHDIISFYDLKYKEITEKYKSPHQLDKESLNCLICSTHDSVEKYIKEYNLHAYSFELYIVAFINFIENNLDVALLCFQKCYLLLRKDCTLTSQANIAIIKLNVASILQLQSKFKECLAEYSSLIKLYRNNDKLVYHFSNLYASCYFRIGSILLRNFKNASLSHHFIYKSIILRKHYKETYPFLVYENYISICYRFFALALDNSDSYIYFKNSLKIRREVLKQSDDNYNKNELFFLLYDFIRFLIKHKYDTKTIYKYVNETYKSIITLPNDLLKENQRSIYYCLTIMSGFSFKNHYVLMFYKSFSLIKYLSYNYQSLVSLTDLKLNKIYQKLFVE